LCAYLNAPVPLGLFRTAKEIKQRTCHWPAPDHQDRRCRFPPSEGLDLHEIQRFLLSAGVHISTEHFRALAHKTQRNRPALAATSAADSAALPSIRPMGCTLAFAARLIP